MDDQVFAKMCPEWGAFLLICEKSNSRMTVILTYVHMSLAIVLYT